MCNSDRDVAGLQSTSILSPHSLERLSYMKSAYFSKPLCLSSVLIKGKILSLSSQC